jgi:hypothetical protein
MTLADSGRGKMQVGLSVLTPNNEELPNAFVRRFLRFTEEFPDYESPRVTGPFGMNLRSSFMHDNRDFWREYAEYLRVDEGLIMVQLVLRNSSLVQLSNAKLEVSVEALDGQGCEIFGGYDVPEEPRPRSEFVVRTRDLPVVLAQQGQQLVVDSSGAVQVCNIRFGTLLPGEECRSADKLVVLAHGPGKWRLRCRILASELAAPQEVDRTVEVTGDIHQLDFEGFKRLVSDRLERINSTP